MEAVEIHSANDAAVRFGRENSRSEECFLLLMNNRAKLSIKNNGFQRLYRFD